MTAPDRIWAWPDDVEEGYMAASRPGNPPTEEYADGSHIEYVRADLVDELVRALEEAKEDIDRYIWHEYPSDHPVHERYRARDFAANPARIALARYRRGITSA